MVREALEDLSQGYSLEKYVQRILFFSGYLLMAFGAVIWVVCDEFAPDDPSQNLRSHRPESDNPPSYVLECVWVGSA